jgi:hypothetical protein
MTGHDFKLEAPIVNWSLKEGVYWFHFAVFQQEEHHRLPRLRIEA